MTGGLIREAFKQTDVCTGERTKQDFPKNKFFGLKKLILNPLKLALKFKETFTFMLDKMEDENLRNGFEPRKVSKAVAERVCLRYRIDIVTHK